MLLRLVSVHKYFSTRLWGEGEKQRIPQNKQINNRGRSAILAHDMGCDNGGCLFARFVIQAASQDSAYKRNSEKRLVYS